LMEPSDFSTDAGGKEVLIAVRTFLGFFARLRGLAWYPAYPFAYPAYFPRCRGIHTIGLRFPLDVVMLDREGLVTARYENLGPFRFRWNRNACSVLEMPAGSIHSHHLRPGDRVRVWKAE
jgi:uncharacterized protein